MIGFLVSDYHDKYENDFYELIPKKVARGEIKYTETAVHSLDEAPQLILDVQQGRNSGKAVVKLVDE